MHVVSESIHRHTLRLRHLPKMIIQRSCQRHAHSGRDLGELGGCHVAVDDKIEECASRALAPFVEVQALEHRLEVASEVALSN